MYNDARRKSFFIELVWHTFIWGAGVYSMGVRSD